MSQMSPACWPGRPAGELCFPWTSCWTHATLNCFPGTRRTGTDSNPGFKKKKKKFWKITLYYKFQLHYPISQWLGCFIFPKTTTDKTSYLDPIELVQTKPRSYSRDLTWTKDKHLQPWQWLTVNTSTENPHTSVSAQSSTRRCFNAKH